MKTISTLIGTTAIAGLLCVGCSKSESNVDSAGGGPEAVVVEEVSIGEAVTEAADTAKKALSDANTKAQELLTQAQTLVSEKKYEEATSLLQKLSDLELTPEQQKMLDNLKATIQKAIESDAVKEGAKAIGNLLGGEK